MDYIDRESIAIDTSRRQLKDFIWARSKVLSHEKQNLLLPFLWIFKELVQAFLTRNKKVPTPPQRRPQPPPPPNLNAGSYRPPRYFTKGSVGKESPQPIPYLLIETQELSQARPVPGNSLFLRSISKGKGVLKKNVQGLFYLDIDNRFVLSLVPYLKAFSLVQAPYFNLLEAPNGAHIPIVSPREAAFHYLNRMGEEGKEFSFEIDGLYSLKPTLWPEVEEVWFLKVRSTELEALRERQFLISKPGGHSFHIAVAIKPRQTKRQTSLPLPLMRINVAFLAA